MLCIRWGVKVTGTRLGSDGFDSDGFVPDGGVSAAWGEVVLVEGWSEAADEIRALTPFGSIQSKTTAPARRSVVASITKKAVR
jgi:hypothetical protein